VRNFIYRVICLQKDLSVVKFIPREKMTSLMEIDDMDSPFSFVEPKKQRKTATKKKSKKYADVADFSNDRLEITKKQAEGQYSSTESDDPYIKPSPIRKRVLPVSSETDDESMHSSENEDLMYYEQVFHTQNSLTFKD
jgi:hypothetical protein